MANKEETMRKFISLDNVNDEILVCTESDIESANKFIMQVANGLGVTISDILDPTPYVIERLAVCYACYVRALQSMGTSSTGRFDDDGDIYARKLNAYKKEIDVTIRHLSAIDFTGKQAGGYGSISLYRA